MTKVLVGGATGHLGVEVISALCSRGFEVFGLARPGSQSKLDPYRHLLSGIRLGDVTQPGSLPGAVAGIDTIVSTIGLTTPVRGIEPMQVDYQGNLALLKAAEEASVAHFAYVSLAGIDLPGATDVPVIAAKHRFEGALQASALHWSIARPSGFFWNYGIFLTMARQHSFIPLLGRGDSHTTPVDAGDLANAICDRLDDPGRVYSIGGPEDLTGNQIASMIRRVLGKRVHVAHLPISLVRGAIKLTRPFNSSEADLEQFFAWAMTAEVTADHVGTTTLESWLEANRDRTFTA